MAINFKPINEVPVVEELAEGDMLLVNSSGAAKQIDASKIGGGGGGTTIYIKDFTEGTDLYTGIPCTDAELTQVMTTDELSAAFAAGPVMLIIDMGGMVAWMQPSMSTNQNGTIFSLVNAGETIQLAYLCSDTVTG